jgi:hypothetical protein
MQKPMAMTIIPLDQLANVTGGGDVDYSRQGQWITQTTEAMGRAGLGQKFNNKGLDKVKNPDMTNVVRFPGG